MSSDETGVRLTNAERKALTCDCATGVVGTDTEDCPWHSCKPDLWVDRSAAMVIATVEDILADRLAAERARTDEVLADPETREVVARAINRADDEALARTNFEYLGATYNEQADAALAAVRERLGSTVPARSEGGGEVGTGAGEGAPRQDTGSAWVTRSADCPEAPAQAHLPAARSEAAIKAEVLRPFERLLARLEAWTGEWPHPDSSSPNERDRIRKALEEARAEGLDAETAPDASCGHPNHEGDGHDCQPFRTEPAPDADAAALAPVELPEAVERASRVFGWQHLVKYAGQTQEWMDATLDALVRAALADPDQAGGEDRA